VPNAIEGRNDPLPNMQIVGERNVPDEILTEWKERTGNDSRSAIFGTTADSVVVGGAPEALPEAIFNPGAVSFPAEAPPPEPPTLPAEPGSADLSSQVQAWIAIQKEKEAQEEAERQKLYEAELQLREADLQKQREAEAELQKHMPPPTPAVVASRPPPGNGFLAPSPMTTSMMSGMQRKPESHEPLAPQMQPRTEFRPMSIRPDFRPMQPRPEFRPLGFQQFHLESKRP